MPSKRTTHKRQTSGRRTSPVRHRRPNVFVRLLQRLPGWAWWIGGLSVVAVYVYFFYYIFVGPFGFRWRALYGEVSYPDGFIMIKATEGASRVDQNFKDNFHQAREYGFTRGAYHFYSVYSPADKQAQFFIKNVKLENGDLPPVLDVEHKPKNQTDEQFAASVNEFLSFRRFKILPDRNKGFVSHEDAVKKAEEEYNEFNKTQKIVSDFDKEISLLLGQDNN